MSPLARLRPVSLDLLRRRRFFSSSPSSPSSILSPDSSAPLSSKEKTRAALSLLKAEKNPERIIDICRAASLTPQSHLDRVAFSVAISKLTESSYFDGIRRFLEESKGRPDLRNERFMCHAIVLYGQAGMLNEAIDTFKHVEELGIRRTVKSLNALLFASIVAKDFKETKRIFMEFPRIYSVAPDLETFNTVIKAFSESESTSSAYSALAEMDRKGVKPNATTFGTMLAGFYKEEKYEDVGKVLELMQKYGVARGVSIYNIRIQSLCKLRKSDEAKVLLDGMLARGMKPNSETYAHLIHGFCTEERYDEAKKMFKSMMNHGCRPTSDCYFTFIHYLCKGGEFDTALQICKESMEKGWIPNFGTMKSLVNGLVSIDKVDEARELIKQVKERFSRNTDLWDEVEAGLPQ